MKYYKDLRGYIEALEKNDKLVRVKQEINKDTELMPLVRWQYRGLPENQRKAFLFENVTDAKGKKYTGSVLVAAYGASRDVYALGMMCRPDEIIEKHATATANPIEPKMVTSGACQEEVHMGDDLVEWGGLGAIPIPISTPGFDGAPFITAGNWVSKDLDTGVRNIGTYRAMIKGPTWTAINFPWPQHIRKHWEKCREKSVPLQTAIVVGVIPSISYTSVAKVPEGIDEYMVAGGIGCEPIELVKCKTVDIEVPAHAEIVIEGELETDFLEREGPFGEHTGYICTYGDRPIFKVTCITHRKNPIYSAFISQFPPSESSLIRGIADDAALYRFLKNELNVPGIRDVHWHEESGSWQFCAISVATGRDPSLPWKVLKGADAFSGAWRGKIVIVVDDDIDPRDPDSIIWALCYRMQPDKDILVTKGKTATLDPSSAPWGTPMPPGYLDDYPTSAILINATMKYDYPPTALPAEEYMVKAKKIWEDLGLPALKPKVPWFGRSFGRWPKEFEEEAKLAVEGEHYQTGDKLAKQRKKI